MRMVSHKRLVMMSVLLGIAFALGSSFIRTPSIRIGVDVISFGAPLVIISRVIPTRFSAIHWSNAVLDAVFWGMIAYFVIGAAIAMLRNDKHIQRSAVRPEADKDVHL